MSNSSALSTHDANEFENAVDNGEGIDEENGVEEDEGFGTIIRFQRRPTAIGKQWATYLDAPSRPTTTTQETPTHPDVPRRRTSSVLSRSTGLILSTTYLTSTYGGAPTYYSLCLSEKCTSTVVVHLQFLNDSNRVIKLSSDRITFSPENYNEPQIVRVEMTDISSHTNMIVHRVYSLDKKYDRIPTPNVVVEAECSGVGSLITIGGTTTKVKSNSGGPIVDLSGSMVRQKSSDLSRAMMTPGTNGICDPHVPTTRLVVNHMGSGDGFTVIVAKQQTEQVLSWGTNQDGELGIGSTSHQNCPQKVQLRSLNPSTSGEHFSIVSVACGQHHVAMVTSHGRLFTWGNNKYGQLGHGEYFTNSTVPREVVLTPAVTAVLVHTNKRALRIGHQLISGPTTANVTQVACGANHTLVVTHQQQVLSCGYNQAGQLGLGHCMQQHNGWRSTTLTMIQTLTDRCILGIAAGQNHSACVLSNGHVYVWGCSEDGRLGISTNECQVTPVPVSILKELGIRARTIRCGARHTAIISDCDLLYLWGGNEFGQLGCGDTRSRTIPWLIHVPTCLSTEGVVDVSLGEFHSVCVTQKGSVYAWGLDLENVQIKPRWYPERIELEPKEKARQVVCGWSQTTLLTQLVAETSKTSDDDEEKTEENKKTKPITRSTSRTHLYKRRERHQLQSRKQEVAEWTRMTSKRTRSNKKNKEKKQSVPELNSQPSPKKNDNVVVEKKMKEAIKVKKVEPRQNPLKGVFYHSELNQPPPVLPSSTLTSAVSPCLKLRSSDVPVIPTCPPSRPTTASPRTTMKKCHESRSPRHIIHNSVVETLLHQPSFSLTTSLLQKKSY